MKKMSLSIIAAVFLLSLLAPAVAAGAPRDGASAVVPLGIAIHEGRLVEGYALIHERGVGASETGRSSRLYDFIARGMRWRTVEPYVVDPANGHGLRAAQVEGAVASSMAAWEAAAGADIFGEPAAPDAPVDVDWASPDGVNEVCFVSGGLDPRIVAVTIVWGVFTGPQSERVIVEWDLAFNDAQPEAWGDAEADPTAWDLQGIATHELGHAVGLDDLYQTAASAQTMYGYASPGETEKRTLEAGDIAGALALYR